MVHHSFDKLLDVKAKRGSSSDKNCRKEQSKMGFCVTKFVEFCKRTDLHGYKYIVMEDLNFFERSVWAFAVLVSTGFAAYFVITAYKWYARNPIATVIESTQGAIWDIPFPAVTICDLNLISRKAARVFADNLTLTSDVTADEIFEIIRLAPLLHSTYVLTADQKHDLHKLQAVLDLNTITMETLFRQLSTASSCNQLVQRCMWKNTIYRCDVLFQQVFTYFNLCCAFNYYAVDMPSTTNKLGDRKTLCENFYLFYRIYAHMFAWWSGILTALVDTYEFNQSNDIFQLEKPRRVASCGYQTALTVLLNADPDDYYSASVASLGALVLIDNAYNVPDLDSPVRLVNPATEVLIALSPERTYTTSGVKAFRPQDRQCYYNDEVQIGSFRQYSFHNCIAYQRVQAIKNACGCMPFYFPVKNNNRICNFNDMDCLESVTRPQHNDSKDQKEFQCLPECEHYDYPLEVALGKLAKNVKLDGLPFFTDISLENRSLLNVFFNDLVSTRYRRDVYLNWQNLLASFGGLLSLMLGFTLISGFDLILFFTFGFAYAGTTALHDQKHKKETAKVLKNRKINVQEFKKPNKEKILSEKEIRNLQFEIQYGNIRY